MAGGRPTPNGWMDEYAYDVMGRLVKVTDTDPSGKDIKQQKHAYKYDDCGNMIYDKKERRIYIMSGYSKFGSISIIMNYDFRTAGEVNQALNELKAMYDDGNISDRQYRDVRAYLEAKLDDLR